VQTNADSVANIKATGSSVLVMNVSLVQYIGTSALLTRKPLPDDPADEPVKTSHWVQDLDGSILRRKKRHKRLLVL
jgi:hypothetical protein